MILSKKHIAVALIAVFAITFLGIKKYESRQTFNGNNIKVVLDAGHGEPDGGAVGVNGTLEKDINLAIVEKLHEVLEGNGITVIRTRSGDSGLQDADAETIRKMKISDMHKRREIINDSNADLFLTIHMNSFANAQPTGLHIFYDKEHPEAEELAENIQVGISKLTGAKTHAVKTADEKLFLMKSPPMPSILAECGFLSNPEEEKRLNDEEYQAKIAWAIAEEILKYFNNN